ncbi:Eco57I restriction-modification methylase domain-containing protein [Thermodesulfobacteriota bacterium]
MNDRKHSQTNHDDIFAFMVGDTPDGYQTMPDNHYVSLTKEEIKQNGIVYTPNKLASFVAEKIFQYFFDQEFLNHIRNMDKYNFSPAFSNFNILDPACGNGELLIAAWKSLAKWLERLGKVDNYVPLTPESALVGIDLEKKAVKIAKQRIKETLKLSSKVSELKILNTNALFPYNRKTKKAGWGYLYKKYNITEGFDIVIANPPWGADTNNYKNNFKNGEYELFKGQVDTSDLFIELALSIVRQNGYIAFIVSDSLFNKERTHLRKLLLEQTDIKFIGRFGEKIFENINRACAVIICKKKPPNPNNETDCFRLNPELRKNILSGDTSFAEADISLSHKVKQNRFLNNSYHCFDIDLKSDEEKILKRINYRSLHFRDFLSSSRGIELSKLGKVIKCSFCNLWFPFPRSKSLKCPHCKSGLKQNELSFDTIISETKKNGYRPLLVGESVWRYKILKNKWINIKKKGIKYKDSSLYQGPKLLVRKTGVGILSMIDINNSMTNQVVYIFKLKQNMPYNLPLEFFLALLNSRAIYYYLVKRFGETEWRSHPYLTQTQILDLPIPDTSILMDKVNQINEIKKVVSLYIKKDKEISPRHDAKIERTISDLFGMVKEDYLSIYKTIDEVQNLLPIMALKKVSCSDIFSF